MKNLWSLFAIGIFAVVLFGGLQTVNTYVLAKGAVDVDSINLISKYDPVAKDLLVTYEGLESSLNKDDKNQFELERDSNQVDAFVREYSETKDKITIMREGYNMVYKIPDIIILSIPFLDLEDLTLYRNIIWIIIIMVTGLALIKALFGRNPDKD